MNPASDDRHLGEYCLKELISETALTRRWLAEQVSVARRVLVDELRPEQADQREKFLADIRAKAAVEHPLVGSVYEAVSDDEQCYYAHELLPGATLDERLKAGEPFKPARLAHLLRRISEAQLQHEALGQSTSPLDLENVHVDAHGGVRLENLAIAGTRADGESKRDIQYLGKALLPLVADGKAGTTRMFTLLGWMRGEGIEYTLTWAQVRDICGQIEQQLAKPAAPTPRTKFVLKKRKPSPIGTILVVVGIALLAVLAVALYLRQPSTPAPPPRAELPGAILIPDGKHPTPDGAVEELPAFQISANEVTIGQYAEFLDTLDTLSKDRRNRLFDHESQPPAKSSHLPDDWAPLLAAAKAGGTWNNRPVTLDCPVVGVDWWDCSAYATWKHGRLPTQEEWFAALRVDVAQPATMKPGTWMPVTSQTTDRTPQGIIGMAGSVCEWTRRPAANPTNPLGERKWVIIGGSFLKSGSNALTREWTDDRSLRRKDLGFRIVFDAN